MCIGSGKKKPFGFLFKNQWNQFVYGCSQCDYESRKSLDLEQHTTAHIVEENELPCNLPTMIFESLAPIKSEVLAEDNIQPILDELDMAIYLPAFEMPENSTEQNPKDELIDDVFDYYSIFSMSSASDEDAFDENQTKTKQVKCKGAVNNREFICDLCTRSFASLARIRQHIHDSHVKDKKKQLKRQVCHCGKNVLDLTTHLKYFHGNERPHKCKYCDASFKQKVHLNTHTRQHEGVRPYICERCVYF